MALSFGHFPAMFPPLAVTVSYATYVEGEPWVAIWSGSVDRSWELTVLDETGAVVFCEPTDAPRMSPHPRDGFLDALGFTVVPEEPWRLAAGGNLQRHVYPSPRWHKEQVNTR